MCWIVHILILDWQVLCTAVHASVQHRISLYTPKSLHKEKIDRGRINGTLRYMYTVVKSKETRCHYVCSTCTRPTGVAQLVHATHTMLVQMRLVKSDPGLQGPCKLRAPNIHSGSDFTERNCSTSLLLTPFGHVSAGIALVLGL